MVRQLLRLTRAVLAAAEAHQQHRQTDLFANDVRARLARVHELLPAGQQAPLAVAEAELSDEARAMLERVRATEAKPATEAARPGR